MRFAFVTPEISPFVGGGIAPMVRATAQILAGAGHDVDIFTRGGFRAQAAALFDERLPLLSHPRIRWHWAPEPRNDSDDWHAEMAESFARTVRFAYRDQRPDLIELQDYIGSGAALLGDRSGVLASVPMMLRLNTSSQQAGDLDGVQADKSSRKVHELERASLRSADLLLGPSQTVGDYYASFYDGEQLPEFRVLWPGFLRDDAPRPQPQRLTAQRRLDLLFLGRAQGFKGVLPLVEALLARPSAPIHLTLVGGDTQTAPGGGSMREHLIALAGDDRRVEFRERVPRSHVGELLAAADALVVPSLWETWGNVALEALAARRPLLVTPVASLPEMAGDGQFGIVAGGIDAGSLGAMLDEAVDRLPWLRSLSGARELTDHLDRLTDEARVASEYEDIARTLQPIDR